MPDRPRRPPTGGRRAAGGRSGGTALVLLAAGAGTRVGRETNKVFLPLAGRRVLTWSLDTTERLPDLVATVVVLQDHDREHLDAVLHREAVGRDVEVVRGGDTRHASELAALRLLAPRIAAGEIDLVMIHDAARPLASARLFESVAAAARADGGALPVLDTDGLVYEDGAGVAERLVAVQTPQAFHAAPLLAAYEAAARDGFVGSDTAACVERYSDLRVHGIAGRADNVKITFSEDLVLAERL
ncbi:MAG TPA: 2-C-methyl-D-erythritol 4-phosphate cytidylyltransferase, partial [Actinomycetales bacterium]